jgi:hypothetical protein
MSIQSNSNKPVYPAGAASARALSYWLANAGVAGLVIENRTSDPASPVVGQMWLRTDL